MALQTLERYSIRVSCIGFPTFTIDDIDVDTFGFEGPSDGHRMYSMIRFVAKNARKVVKEISKKFPPAYMSLSENHIWVSPSLNKKENRGMINIKMENGFGKITKPPSFCITSFRNT